MTGSAVGRTRTPLREFAAGMPSIPPLHAPRLVLLRRKHPPRRLKVDPSPAVLPIAAASAKPQARRRTHKSMLPSSDDAAPHRARPRIFSRFGATQAPAKPHSFGIFAPGVQPSYD